MRKLRKTAHPAKLSPPGRYRIEYPLRLCVSQVNILRSTCASAVKISHTIPRLRALIRYLSHIPSATLRLRG
jgi:hypothetical protein